MMASYRFILLSCFIVMAALAAGSAKSAVAADEWAARLDQDARAMHAALAGSHPGPVDPENPGFAAMLDDGLRHALARVSQTRDFGGYWWAMREFQASFEDGHVQLGTTSEAPQLPIRWPGFLTRYEDDRQIVATRLDQDGAPPLGAELIECDGMAATELAYRQVGKFRGRWFLESQRAQHGGRLFLDTGNPWIRLPRRCSFNHDGTETEVVLDWQPLDNEAFARNFNATLTSAGTDTGLRTFGEDGLWLSMASFDGDVASPQFALLSQLNEKLGGNAQVATARKIVLDVRGNGGGSSHWAYLVARQLWGSQAIEATESAPSDVDWRVSTPNIQAIHDFQQSLQNLPSADPEVLRWATTVADGLAGAQREGLPLWRQAADQRTEEDAPPKEIVPRRMRADVKVYVLTDAICASACLDAVDLWRSLGAVQIGRTTSADSVYMEVREETLPSGLARIAVPMKVYRGRTRGNNEPWVPQHLFQGSMQDNAALESWVRRLP